VEYKKSKDFAKASALGKKNRGKKEDDHHLGRGGYAFAIPKWREMEEDLLTQGTIPAVVDWPERVKNWYYAHGGTINSEGSTLDYPPSLREAALEILEIIEYVSAGRVKVNREINDLVGTFNTFIHKTFLTISRIVLNISCCVLDRGSIVLIRRYVQVHVRLTTLLVDEGCNRICTTSNNVDHKVVMVVIHLE
jgi:hypothetical protein